jgi:nitroreductase
VCPVTAARIVAAMTRSLDPETVRAAVELAVRAPSIHNSQPWRFLAGPHSVELHADPGRRLGATDPDGRDQLISCGAALHHLRVGLSALGWLPVTQRLPDPDRPDHLATVGTWPRVPRQDDLLPAVSIPRRRSDRRGYHPRPVPAELLDELARRAAAEGVRLRVAGGAVHTHLASVIAEADQLQRVNPSYVYELARWARPPRCSPSEVDGAGTLLVLGTGLDDRLARLRAGEATSAVLLAATRMGLAGCPLTQPLEVPATREVVRTEVLHAEFVPQMVLRIGWPPRDPNPFPATTRRPVAAVLTWRTDDQGLAIPGPSTPEGAMAQAQD